MMKLDLTTILVAILAILILCIAFMKKSAPASEGFRRRRFTAAADPKKVVSLKKSGRSGKRAVGEETIELA
jgi:hypothetical protein